MRADLADRLSADLAAIAKDANELFRGDGDDLAARTREIRDRLAEVLQTTDKTIEKLSPPKPSPVGVLDEMIRERPYHAIGIAVGVGFVLALLLKKK